MAKVRMHPNQVDTDRQLVDRLVRSQFPQWSDRSIVEVDSFGTDHDIYRLGDDLVARLPKIEWASPQAAKEAEWLPILGPHLPLDVPVQVAVGRPEHGYPFSWSICEWLPGQAASHGIDDLERAAVDLATFILSLRAVDTSGAPVRPVAGRGGPLVEGDEFCRWSISQLGARIDGPRALRLWEEALEVSPWEGNEVWVHGDLLPGNLLLRDGRMTAVIDWGGLNVGDPACDLQPAWHVFTGTSRQTFRTALGGVDEDSWLRGKGWVVRQTVSALAYYWDTNPGMVRQASRALREVLGDTS